MKIVLFKGGFALIGHDHKMSPTSISGGGKILTDGELISLASLKGQCS